MKFPQDFLPTPKEMLCGGASYLSGPREEAGNRNRALFISALLFIFLLTASVSVRSSRWSHMLLVQA